MAIKINHLQYSHEKGRIMIIQYFWRNCDLWGSDLEAEPIDAFWIEATKKEAESIIFP